MSVKRNIPRDVTGALVPFGSYLGSTPVVPDIYWDVYSSEQRWKWICCNLIGLINYSDEQTKQINLNTEEIEKLKELFEKFKESGFEDYYKEQLKEWIENNLALLYEQLATQVFFGLTSDGYFCAYVPDSWSDIQFDTGMVYGRSDYGRLILRFDAEGQGVINNTYSYTISSEDADKALEMLTELQGDVELIEKVLYTPMNELVQGGK